MTETARHGAAGEGTPATVSFAGVGGLRLVADVWGEEGRPTVLLWHGGGQTRHSWRGTARALADRGWRAFTLDLRGHGDSDWSAAGAYDLVDFGGDVAAVAGTFPEPPALVGASLGGIASLTAVGEAEAPLARALVLVDVAPRTEVSGRDRISDFMRSHLTDGFASLDEVADAVAAYNPHRPRPSDPSGLRKNLRRGANGRWFWHWDPKFFTATDIEGEPRTSLVNADRLEAAARRLALPTLLVRGRESDLLSEEGARQFLDLVPHAEYVDVAGAGHMIAGDRNDIFNDAVIEFLERTRAA